MISSNKRLAELDSPVHLIFFEDTSGCEACPPTRRLLQHLATLNPHVTLETRHLVLDRDEAERHGVDRAPAILLSAPERDRIRFYGAPLGNELPALVEAIERTASGESGLSESSRARLATLTKPVRIQVFFTPTCVYCPQMIALANRIAVESPLVTATAIDATEYPDLVQRYNVNGVPKTVIDGSIEVLGAATEDELVLAVTR
jgi:glutaredoxin-like protein